MYTAIFVTCWSRQCTFIYVAAFWKLYGRPFGPVVVVLDLSPRGALSARGQGFGRLCGDFSSLAFVMALVGPLLDFVPSGFLAGDIVMHLTYHFVCVTW